MTKVLVKPYQVRIFPDYFMINFIRIFDVTYSRGKTVLGNPVLHLLTRVNLKYFSALYLKT